MKRNCKILPSTSKPCVIPIFVLLLIANYSLLSQSITWQRIYDGWSGRTDYAYSCCKADGSNFYAVGFGGSPVPSFFILKINGFGDTIWTKKFGQGGEAFSVAPANDGGCVFTGDFGQTFAVRLKPNGDTLWQKFYDGNRGYDIKNSIDGGFFICGELISGSNFGSFVLKIDSLGNQIWFQSFFGGGGVDFSSLCVLSNSIIASGDRFDAGTGTYQSSITSIDLNGNEMWHKIYKLSPANTYASAVESSGSNLVIAGTTRLHGLSDSIRIYLLKTNLIGDSIGIRVFSSAHTQANPVLLKINSNKYFLSCYNNPNQFTFGETWIRALDSSFNILRQCILRPDTNEIFIKSLITAPSSISGDIICVGGTDQLHYSDEDVYLVRLDSSISQPPPIGINSYSNDIPIVFKLNQNYPNPFNPTTKLTFDIPKSSLLEVAVYDVLGRRVWSYSEFKPAGQYAIDFDGSNLASGLYFYRFTAGSFSETRKMVLLK